MAMTSYNPGGAEVPAPGGDYTAGPTPHAANVDHTPYQAPTSVPSGNGAPSAHEGFDGIDGLGEATQL